MDTPLLRALTFDELAGWRDDPSLAAFEAFRRSAFHAARKPYRAGSLGFSSELFARAYAAARLEPARSENEAKQFFERFFAPARLRPDHDAPYGLVTGFYEPEAEASPTPTKRFTVPLYSPPHDLVAVNESNRPPGLASDFAWARQTPTGLAEYFDRAAIENGALAGQGLEIAWLVDPVDVFFIHIQGAARLAMTDNTSKRVTYAAKSGQPFTAIGRVLADHGEIPLSQVTMQSIRAWLRAHPDRARAVMHMNRSFIFFREAPVEDDALGPVAAAKVPLTPGRSVAVDRLIHTFGTPIFIDAPDLPAFGPVPFRRLLIAQDTGSAITGTARGDLFAGSGDAAGEIAGTIRHAADFTVLVPRGDIQP